MKRSGDYAMHNHCADLHVAGGGISPPKSPRAIERTFSLIRSPLPTHRAIVAHSVHFAAIFDLQFLIELIEQYRVHWIISHGRYALGGHSGSRFTDGREAGSLLTLYYPFIPGLLNSWPI